MPIIRLIKNLFKKPPLSEEVSLTRMFEQHPNAHIIKRSDHCISRADISPNALKVTHHLHQAGFEAYLVGGSVRDLLLRHAPKDFDIATSARPEEIRRLFRNCRLIGKRFRLAHILFGREIIEVATFRKALPEDASNVHRTKEGMIVRDNVYGNLEDDALRRDFTLNAIYYNSADFTVIDLTQGTQDLANKIIRTIGNPLLRFQEDPVRMIRAIRFAAKLDFTLDPDLAQALKQKASSITQASSARLFEESIKLFHSGHAVGVYEYLKKFHLLQHLFPDTALALKKPQYDQLLKVACRNTDIRIQEEKPLTPAFLFMFLLWPALEDKTRYYQKQNHLPPLTALEQAMNDVLERQYNIIAIPKRFTQMIRQIWLLQYLLPRRSGKRPYRNLSHPRFRAAYDFLVIRGEAGEVSLELCEWWGKFQHASSSEQQAMIEALEQNKKRPKRKLAPPDADIPADDE